MPEDFKEKYESVLKGYKTLAEQLHALLAHPRAGDDRSALGAERGGRPASARIAGAVATAAQG